MSQIPWTKEQKSVINTSGKNILVAAGAGSGKTAVLVERIIKKVTNPENPVDIDQFLIVTFTKAAAAQMREKIRDELYRLSFEDPDDDNLKRQLSLVHTANISTIDSFAKKVVSTNFDQLDIDPSFRLMETEESELMLEDYTAETIDELFEEDNEEFVDAMQQLAKGDVFTDVVDKVTEIVKKAKNQEYPVKWMEESINKNYCETEADFEEKAFTKWFVKGFEKYKNFYDDLWTATNNVKENETPTAITQEILENVERVLVKLDAASTYKEYREAILSYGKRAKIRQGGGFFDEFKIHHEKLIDYLNIYLGENTKPKYFPSPEEAMEDVNRSQLTANVLLEISIKAFNKCLNEKKRISAYDFSDVAHFAIDILCVPGEDGPTASDTAKRMSENFHEILIDEYQDSNYIQEYMLFALSKGRGINNVFMVGDIKQSIYRFRSAEPKIFLEKFNTYKKESDEHTRIILGKNFRSRPEIIDFTNYVFDELMVDEVGGIEYKDGQELSLGATNYNLTLNSGKQDNKTEILCIPSHDVNRHVAEANLIAKRIINMMDENTGLKISDEKANQRPLEYRDIVILTKAPKTVVDTYIEILEGYGIPVFGQKRDGFYESTEIKIILDFLATIDNPMQDIPLAGVMTSAFYKFDESELTQIRLANKENALYQSVLDYAKDGKDDELKEKVNEFLKSFEDYRQRVKYMSVFEFINYFLDCSHFNHYVRSLPAGSRRSLNIDMLKEIAYKYENSSYRSLFNFVRYVNKNIDNNKEIGEASNVHEDDNVVRITSIHQSKGLEFPVVILSNAAGGKRGGGNANDYLINSDGDVGLDVLDTDNKTKTDTLLERYIESTEKEEEKAEELRLLYVAMTRAKEKLIIIATKQGKKIERKDFATVDKKFKKDAILKTGSFYQMIAPIIGEEVKDEVPDEFNIDSDEEIIEKDTFRLEMYPSFEHYCCSLKDFEDSIDDRNLESDEDITKKIAKNFDYKYRYKEEAKLRAKMSVTEIKRNLSKEFVDEDAEIFFPDRTTEAKPNFVEKKESEFTAADIGNIYHKIFELLDYSLEITDQKVMEEFLKQLVEDRKFTQEEIDQVEIEQVMRFARSTIATRMKAAFERGELYRERKFLMQVDGEMTKRIQKLDVDTDETTIVQGIIDACFVEDSKYVIVDYKTDDVNKMEQLVKRYDTQLDQYELAIKKISGMDVSEKIIYSVKLGEEVKV